MRGGDFVAAWRISELELRRHSELASARLPRHLQAVWDGTSLRGKRVLVRCYHGLGDTLQFIRFIPALKAVAAEVLVWAQPSLLSLLSTVSGIDRLMPLNDGAPDCQYDVDVEIMELPFVFRTTLQSLPAAVPYLHVGAASLSDQGFKVGVVWRGGEWDSRRDVPFVVLAELAQLPGASFYVLQQITTACEHHARFKRILPPDSDGLTTARIMRALDLVISIDSMTAHLAGALAMPTWILLHKDADWRWMHDRDDSPWYPTMRLYRQRRAGDWAPVIARVKAELRELIRSR